MSFRGPFDPDKFSNLPPINNMNDLLTSSVREQINKSYEISDEIWRQKKEKEEREEQWRYEMLSAVDGINKTLVNQLTNINDTLDFILNSIGGNFQRVQAVQLLTNEKLAELNAIITKRDENGLKKFIADHGFEALGLILQIVSIFSKPA